MSFTIICSVLLAHRLTAFSDFLTRKAIHKISIEMSENMTMIMKIAPFLYYKIRQETFQCPFPCKCGKIIKYVKGDIQHEWM
jgi:hypothetical protein